MTTPTHGSPRAAIRVMRIIGLALGMGVTLFAAVAWILEAGPTRPLGQDPTLLYVWIAFSTTMAAAAMVVWRGQVVPYIEPATGTTHWQDRAARIQTGLVITWALVEAAALFGVVVFFLAGHSLAGAGGVVLIWAAVLLTWPRPAWLDAGRMAA